MDKLTFNFSTDEVNLLLAALGELPAKQSLAIINNIQKQIIEQRQQSEGS